MKEEKILMIVESPNKVATLKEFLPSNYTVMASVGHISRINDSGLYNMGIDVKNNFAVDMIVDPLKKDIIKQLKQNVKLADKVVISSDPDREGEAIAENLRHFLSIPDSKYERVTFHEITKNAVLEALKHPRKIDENMATAALTRSIIDKIVGYRISPIVLTKVSCKSAGRVQSAALKILATREREIINFVPETFYEIWLPFIKNDNTYKAQYKGTNKKKVVSIAKKEDADQVVADCKGHDYILKNIDTKERHISSKPPFTTSSFQQAASALLGYSPKKAMECAQKLFEGIEINGAHTALITYIRTDSTDLNPDFTKQLNEFIKNKYGENYCSAIKTAEQAKNAQNGHEALRCVNLEMTPSELVKYIEDNQLIKIYTIIYNRTVACAMADCIMTDCEYSIYNGDHRFAYSTHSIKFDGFKHIYNYKEEDDDDTEFPVLALNEKLKTKKLDLIEKKTTPPARYTEAKLIQAMESYGIGRPSTFASTVTTLTDPTRNYTELDGKTIKVTDKGLRLSEFLDSSFGDIINLTYTSEMENMLDEIAEGKKSYLDCLNDFYNKLSEKVTLAKGAASNKEPAVVVKDRVCPKCGGQLVIRKSKYGEFIGCQNYPKCKYSEKIIKNGEAEVKSEVKTTGIKCPDCGKDIVRRQNKKTGQYFYACSGYPAHKRIFTELEFNKLVEKQHTNPLSCDKD